MDHQINQLDAVVDGSVTAAALGTADAYTEATAIGSSDVVLTQSIDTFDAAGDQTFEADYNRLPGDTATTGALTSSDAQVSYTADWFDGIGRNVADDDYGAAATAPDPPSATNPAPTSIDSTGATQVSFTAFDAAGEDYLDTDAAGRQALTDFDNEGRVKDTIQNYSTSTGPGWNIENSTVYGDGDNLAYTYVTTANATGGGTTTEYTAYVYGTMLGDTSPAIWSNDLVRAQIAGIPASDLSSAVSDVSDFSSSDDTLAGMDATEDSYDRQAEVATTTDANFTTHTLTYNGLGAESTDTVTVPDGNPANIDLTVTEIAMAYKACGRLQYVTSLNAADDVVNQLYFVYDTNGNLDDEYEEYGGAVNTATSEYVAFGYDNSTGTGYDGALGTSVTIAAAGFRPTTLQYPTTGTDSSRVITDSYGTSGGMDDQINQLEAVVDGSGTADDPTVGDTLDNIGTLGDGTIVSEQYVAPRSSTTCSARLPSAA